MSSGRNFEFTDAKGGAAFTVRVVTRHEKTEYVGIEINQQTRDRWFKIKLMASPAGDPAANEELVEFLAGVLEVDSGAIEIVAGEDKRDKLISVEGISTQDVETKLGSAEA